MIRRIRQPFLLAALAGILSLSGCCDKNPDTTAGTSAATHAAPAKFNLLVGTYTEGPASSGKSKGIPVFRFDTTTGEITHLTDNDGIRNPSWLVVSPNGRHVYAVNELGDSDESLGTGEVSAFAFDATTGKLKFINKVSSEGADPCHLLLQEKFHRLFVSNYTGGTFTLLPVHQDGSLGTSVQSIGRSTKGLKGGIGNFPSTEPLSHIHSVVPLDSDVGVVVQDLGFNQLNIYMNDAQDDAGFRTLKEDGNGRLGLIGQPKNFGPRHLVLNPRKPQHAFVIGELRDEIIEQQLTVSADIQRRKDWTLHSYHLGAPVEPGKGTAAAIHLSDDGKFLYASTRNPKNILVVFTVNPTDGTLREIQTVSSGGKAPREFTIAPGGKFLLVANQQSDAIAVFSRDPETGKITDTGRRIPVGSPTDLKWAPAQ